MHLAPGCTLGTRGPLCDSVALPGTLAGLAVLTVGVHAVGSCPPSCGQAWGYTPPTQAQVSPGVSSPPSKGLTN